MLSSTGYLIDTNVLLRLFRPFDREHQITKTALGDLNGQGIGLYFSQQNIAEFWNVCTRPAERNGYGLSIEQTNQCVQETERAMTFLPDSDEVYSIWRRIVMVNIVSGVQVHDARLAALMQAYGLIRILTMNQSDFQRYASVQAIHPRQLLPSAS